MARTRTTPGEALVEQARAVHSWLSELEPDAFERPSVLPGWSVSTLVAHLVLIHAGFVRILDRPSPERPLAMEELVSHYRRDVADLDRATASALGDRSGLELVDELGVAIEAVAERLLSGGSLPLVLASPRGPVSLGDFVATRVVEVVVHADDLSRSLPAHPSVSLLGVALGTCSRTLTTIIEQRYPGRSVEVRIPPYAAVQCSAVRDGVLDTGPTHTRGTPPNVVETDAVTFFRLCTGRTSWDEALRSGVIAASGLRADLSEMVPLLS